MVGAARRARSDCCLARPNKSVSANKRSRFVLFRLARDSDSGQQRHQRAEQFRSDNRLNDSGVQKTRQLRSQFQNFDLEVLFIDFNCRLHIQVSCPIFHQAITHTRERCLLRSGHLVVEVETMFRVLRSHRFSINRLKLRRYLSTRCETLPPKLELSFRVTRVP